MAEDRGTEIETPKDEFIIGPDEEKKKKPSMMEVMGKMFEIERKTEHETLCKSVKGVSDRVIEEDRDAMNLYRNKEGRCELHGIRCANPRCYICGFADMQDRVACAIMDNVNKHYKPRKKWKKTNVTEKERYVPKDILHDTGEFRR